VLAGGLAGLPVLAVGLLGLAAGRVGLAGVTATAVEVAPRIVWEAGVVAVSLALAVPNAGWNQPRSLEARLSVPRSAWDSRWISAARSSSGARSMSVLPPTSGA
jgi:hypothetical protein